MTQYQVVVRKIGGDRARQSYIVNGYFGAVSLMSNVVKTIVDVYGVHGKIETRMIDGEDLECEVGWIGNFTFTPFLHIEFKEVE